MGMMPRASIVVLAFCAILHESSAGRDLAQVSSVHAREICNLIPYNPQDFASKEVISSSAHHVYKYPAPLFGVNACLGGGFGGSACLILGPGLGHSLYCRFLSSSRRNTND